MDSNNKQKVAVTVFSSLGGFAGSFAAEALKKPVSAQETPPTGEDYTSILSAIAGKLDAVLVTLNNLALNTGGMTNISVQTPWTADDPVHVIDSRPVRDANPITLENMIDLRGAKRVYVHINSTLDQALSTQPTSNYVNDQHNTNNLGAAIPSGAGLPASFGVGNATWAPFVGFIITPAGIPTIGQLDVWVVIQR